jgi:hypothetical protein
LSISFVYVCVVVMSTPAGSHKSSSPPPPPSGSSDYELIDWYLHSVRLSTSQQGVRDVRGVSLIQSLAEFISKIVSVIPSAEDVKNPFDYWSFVESVFSPSLRASMIPETGHLPTPSVVSEAREIVARSFPHYSWTWAVEDCLNTSMLTQGELEKIKSQLPMEPSVSEVSLELEKSLASFDESTKQAAVSLSKLHKWLKQTEKAGDFIKHRNASLTGLLTFAEYLLVQLQREQLLDSIEEVHQYDSDVAVVIDDVDRVRCYITRIEDMTSLLHERDLTLEGPQAESIQYKYPFTSVGARLPLLGPFCHICRQAKNNLVKCSNKLSVYYGDSKDLKSLCHRKFCLDCLVVYNWPKPETSTTSYKCPICAKLCTCDRCVRNVFLKSIRTFISGLKCETANSVSFGEVPRLSDEAVYVSSVRDFLSIVGDMSAFSVIPTTPSLESPSGDVPMAPLSITGRSKRHSVVKQDDVELETVIKKPISRKLSRATSELLDPKLQSVIKSEENASECQEENTDITETPPSDRKRRKAASVAETLFRSQCR